MGRKRVRNEEGMRNREKIRTTSKSVRLEFIGPLIIVIDLRTLSALLLVVFHPPVLSLFTVVNTVAIDEGGAGGVCNGPRCRHSCRQERCPRNI